MGRLENGSVIVEIGRKVVLVYIACAGVYDCNGVRNLDAEDNGFAKRDR